MSRCVVIGECMVEVVRGEHAEARIGYAGDTLNTAVYLARSAAGVPVEVDYLTRLGDDEDSDRIEALLREEGLGTGLVTRVRGRRPGLYLVRSDARGERSFAYYRAEAPARDLLGPDQSFEVDATVATADLVYLSAITLQILTGFARERLWQLLAEVRRRGGRVAFDSNYRPAGWPGPEGRRDARDAIGRTLACTDVALPSLTDEQALHGDADAWACAERLRRVGVAEVVVKDGARPAVVAADDTVEAVPARAVARVVDTTAAGDSFNGAYLAARLRGADPRQAPAAGHALAAEVVQHPGALVR